VGFKRSNIKEDVKDTVKTFYRLKYVKYKGNNSS
jgi:hypothetical protein